VRAVVLIPVGFVSDHMEVVYDLDTEALATAERLGMAARRAGTAGVDPRFVAALRELALDQPIEACPAHCCLPRTSA
jgi:protoporphyrin/coproporphyrin ferrochelatase